MNACLSDFRVVNPTLRTFSAAEARIAQSSIRFNNLSAAELGYPENVRLLISSEGTTLAIQACDKDDPCAVPFMSGRTAEDLKGQKKWTTVSNRMLMHIIRTKLGWDSGKTPRRFYGLLVDALSENHVWTDSTINLRSHDALRHKAAVHSLLVVLPLGGQAVDIKR